MSETTANLLVAVVGALGTVVAALAVFLSRKGLEYLESKTRFLKDEADLRKAESIHTRVDEAVTAAVLATQQTLVDGLRRGSADGRLTGEEAAEAFRRALEGAGTVLEAEGVQIGQDALGLLVEAAVHKLKENKALGKAPGGLKKLRKKSDFYP